MNLTVHYNEAPKQFDASRVGNDFWKRRVLTGRIPFDVPTVVNQFIFHVTGSSKKFGIPICYRFPSTMEVAG